MFNSLHPVDGACLSIADGGYSPVLRLVMKTEDDAEEIKAIGERFRTARDLNKLSLRRVAALLAGRGYADPPGHAAIGHWETGRNHITALWVRRLSRLYGVSADTLLGLNAQTIGEGVSSAKSAGSSTREIGAPRRKEAPPWNSQNHPARRADDRKEKGR